MEQRHLVYFSLGSNLGNRKRLVREAVEQLERHVGKMQKISQLHETEPWGYSSPNKFINACVCCATTLAPRQVLHVTQAIEQKMGRIAKTNHGEYHDRIIDIDILMYDDLVVDEPDLKIPHPLMCEREFVMIPLKEILP